MDPYTLLVANPTAQSGKNAERIARARLLLDHAGLTHRFLPTAPLGGTVAVVRDALADSTLHTVIYMGGDGTFAEVAKGLLASGRDVRMALLPTGTANDQGKSFGLSADEGALEYNVRVIALGHEARLDAGRILACDESGATVREDWFFDSAGWGISPRVLQVRNEDRKLIESVPILRDIYRDQLVYAGALFRTFLKSYVEDDKFDVSVVVDGEAREWTGLSDLIVKGTRVYGGAWVFDPTSRPDDGLFEVIPFAGKRDWWSKAIVHLDSTGVASEGLATLGVKHSEHLRGAQIELHLRMHAGGLPLVAQIDGEEFPATPRARIAVIPRALRLIVPQEFAGGSKTG